MMRLPAIAAILTMTSIHGLASAQNAAAMMVNPSFRDPPPARCVTTFEMQHCAAHDLRVADAAMSRAYRNAQAKSGTAGRARLLTDQRRWLAYRDRHCMAKSDAYGGGTVAPVAFGTCLVEATRARLIYLRGLRR